VEVEEIIKLKSMLKIPSEISQLEYELKHVSENYFQEHSLIGGMMKDEFFNYTSPIDPFTATACIISEENTLKNKIKRYRERFRLFADEFTTEELYTLKRAINANESHPIIEVAIEWLNEVEFYITTRAESIGEQWMNNDEPWMNREETHQIHLKYPKYKKYLKDLELDTVMNEPNKIDKEEFNALEEEFERMVGEWK
jgi:hypothetical protein